MVFQRGTCFAQNENWSVTRRMEGRGGKMYSFWAMYSFRMSFWRVPPTRSQGVPCFSATARYIARAIGAGERVRRGQRLHRSARNGREIPLPGGTPDECLPRGLFPAAAALPGPFGDGRIHFFFVGRPAHPLLIRRAE